MTCLAPQGETSTSDYDLTKLLSVKNSCSLHYRGDSERGTKREPLVRKRGDRSQSFTSTFMNHELLGNALTDSTFPPAEIVLNNCTDESPKERPEEKSVSYVGIIDSLQPTYYSRHGPKHRKSRILDEKLRRSFLASFVTHGSLGSCSGEMMDDSLFSLEDIDCDSKASEEDTSLPDANAGRNIFAKIRLWDPDDPSKESFITAQLPGFPDTVFDESPRHGYETGLFLGRSGARLTAGTNLKLTLGQKNTIQILYTENNPSLSHMELSTLSRSDSEQETIESLPFNILGSSSPSPLEGISANNLGAFRSTSTSSDPCLRPPLLRAEKKADASFSPKQSMFSSHKRAATRELTKKLRASFVPAIINAKAIKKDSGGKVGLRINCDHDGVTLIEAVSEGSPFLDTDLSPGCEVLAVNGVRVRSARKATEIIKFARGWLVILASSGGWRPEESKYVVLRRNSYCTQSCNGICFKTTGYNIVQVAKVDRKGPFGKARVEVGDFCLSINGHVAIDEEHVKSIFEESEGLVPLLIFSVSMFRAKLVKEVVGRDAQIQWSSDWQECTVIQDQNSYPITIKFDQDGLCSVSDTLLNLSKTNFQDQRINESEIKSIADALNECITTEMMALRNYIERSYFGNNFNDKNKVILSDAIGQSASENNLLSQTLSSNSDQPRFPSSENISDKVKLSCHVQSEVLKLSELAAKFKAGSITNSEYLSAKIALIAALPHSNQT